MPKITKEKIKEFIDAVLHDHERAELMLEEQPQLLNARWLHGESLLHHFAIGYDADAVKFLADLGAEVDLKNESGNTALIEVCTLGNMEIAEILLDHGADANAASATFDTALMCAVRAGKPELVELLLQGGADPAQRSPAGATVFDVMPQLCTVRLEIYRVLAKYAPTVPGAGATE
jgi:hypothetical protein